MQNLTHNTRSALIKLASNLPRGSHERRSILAGLNRAAMVPDWQPVTGAALQKAIRIFGGQFRDRGSFEATADAGAPEKLSGLLAKAGFAISPEEIEAAIEVA